MNILRSERAHDWSRPARLNKMAEAIADRASCAGASDVP